MFIKPDSKVTFISWYEPTAFELKLLTFCRTFSVKRIKDVYSDLDFFGCKHFVCLGDEFSSRSLR